MSSELSDPASNRGRLLVRAAEIEFELGHTDLALRLLAEAKPLQLEQGERARLTFLAHGVDQAGRTRGRRI